MGFGERTDPIEKWQVESECMIKLTPMLTEDRNASTDKGCLMAMVPKEYCEKLMKASYKMITDEQLYVEGTEFGREKECHVTVLYGFVPDLNELQIRQLLKGQKPFMVELVGVDKFENNPQFDVVKYQVESPTLRQLNEAAKKYPNQNDYPDYKPHLTIAYVQKGTFPNNAQGIRIPIPIRQICYSPASGAKSYYDL